MDLKSYFEWGKKWKVMFVCLRSSEWRLPASQTQIWWRRVAHCWGCSALLTCTNAANITEMSPPCMLACAACTAASVCCTDPAPTAARRLFTASFVSLLLFVTLKLDSAVTAWSELRRRRFTSCLYLVYLSRVRLFEAGLFRPLGLLALYFTVRINSLFSLNKHKSVCVSQKAFH